MWFQNKLLTTRLQSILKKTNQRIVQLSKTYGPESMLFKEAISVLEKGGASQYTSTSASGNKKIDIRAVNRLIRSGKANRSEINQILSQVAGIKIDENGEIVNVPNSGIRTVSEIRKATRKRMENMGEDPRERTEREIDQFAEALAEFHSNFEHEYEVTVGRVGESTLRSNRVTRLLYGENRTRRLTYNELSEIMREFGRLQYEAKNSALDFEDNNGGNL